MIRPVSMLLVFAASPALADIPTIDNTVLDQREDRDRKTGEIEKVDEERYVNNQSVTCSMYRPGRKDDPVAAANANPAIAGIMGMCLCFDRRWPETYRVMGLQGVEMILVGYNTPAINREAQEPNHLKMFHSNLTMQAGAYQNGTWVVASAKGGREDGFDMLGGSCIISPTGEIVAKSYTLEDELISANCDLDLGKYIKGTVFNFDEYRQPDHYGIIVEQKGIVEPPFEAA